MLNENIKAVRKSKGLSVPDVDMLISISEAFETPVSTLLGETVVEANADDLRAISEKLEVINLQLAHRKATRQKVIHWFLLRELEKQIGYGKRWSSKTRL